VERHYKEPDWFTRNVLNRVVGAFTRAGISLWGSRVLEVPGRRSGQPRRVPVNLLTFDGGQYLVAPRGETDWVRNTRAAAGRVTLIRGRRRQTFTAMELPDGSKPAVLRAYLARGQFVVGMFFDGGGPESSDEQLAAIAGAHPVFRLEPLTAAG
jgi:deazaflavin-dependent oxidoreductase (nitroreductase family)